MRQKWDENQFHHELLHKRKNTPVKSWRQQIDVGLCDIINFHHPRQGDGKCDGLTFYCDFVTEIATKINSVAKGKMYPWNLSTNELMMDIATERSKILSRNNSFYYFHIFVNNCLTRLSTDFMTEWILSWNFYFKNFPRMTKKTLL